MKQPSNGKRGKLKMDLAACDLVRELKKAAKVPQGKMDCDPLLLGDSGRRVRKVAVSFMATSQVLKKAVAEGCDMLIVHEPPFYNLGPDWSSDPVVSAKRRFIEESGIVLWQCHDALHFTPDWILDGLVAKLGWDAFREGPASFFVKLPPRSLQELAREIALKLGISGVRVAGLPHSSVSRLALSPGCPYWKDHLEMLSSPGADAILCGEIREWETCEYVRDMELAGRVQSLVVAGHRNTEEPGMELMASRLSSLFDVQVSFIPAGDPFWHV